MVNIKLVEYEGTTQSIAAWSRDTGITSTTISARLLKGWSVKDALTTPSRNKMATVMHKGKYRTVGEMAVILGLSPSTLYLRLQRGQDITVGHDLRKLRVRKVKIKKRKLMELYAFGEYKPLVDWAREYSIDQNTLRQRIIAGRTPEEALTKSVVKKELRHNKPTNGAHGGTWDNEVPVVTEDYGYENTINSMREQGFTDEQIIERCAKRTNI